MAPLHFPYHTSQGSHVPASLADGGAASSAVALSLRALEGREAPE